MQFFYALPMQSVFIGLLLIIILWSIVYVKSKETFSKRYIYLNRLLLALFIFIVIDITLLLRHINIKEIDLIPFHSFFKAQIQPEIYRSMFMNIVLFFPIGIFMPFSFKIRSYNNILYTIIFALIFSILIETIQYIFSLGYCEIDDVIMNSLGALIGTLSFLISKFIENKVGMFD